MCVSCIRSQVDITDGIQKQLTILFCRDCGRYLQPPRHWVRADPESRELLTFCSKRVKGLSKVKLVDAGFIWTEPHSKRLKVKLTVQGEVLGGAILQQSFVIEYVVENHMCIDCNRHNANPNSWTACVQVGSLWFLFLLFPWCFDYLVVSVCTAHHHKTHTHAHPKQTNKKKHPQK